MYVIEKLSLPAIMIAALVFTGCLPKEAEDAASGGGAAIPTLSISCASPPCSGGHDGSQAYFGLIDMSCAQFMSAQNGPVIVSSGIAACDSMNGCSASSMAWEVESTHESVSSLPAGVVGQVGFIDFDDQDGDGPQPGDYLCCDDAVTGQLSNCDLVGP
ncbi:MAG: hypothetical protein H6626_05625 [Pseudobdellovibrionaceae bacterium]|mgnify:CR=1 FL=1|nr:hypothetical protein [Bdellovibrionales bacterium]USN48573.1 MAG: hypothetical protein H6626_05625 [Pseudobdellovibrionaceae bacterium]